MIERRLAVGETPAEDRQQAEVEVLFTAKRQPCRESVSRADSGQTARTAAGSGREGTAGDGRRQRTSSGQTPRRTGRCCRRDVTVVRAGAFDVGTLDTARGFALATAGGASFYAEVGPQGVRIKTPRLVDVVAHGSQSRPAASRVLWPSRVPAIGACAAWMAARARGVWPEPLDGTPHARASRC